MAHSYNNMVGNIVQILVKLL